jgi:quercetin dioxygenase-like cupin family protein
VQLPTFDQFRSAAHSRGCTEVLERTWPANAVLAEHVHEFDADAVVAKGEMWLTVGDQERRLVAGDTFALPRGTPHAERYGPEGATYWVARRQ